MCDEFNRGNLNEAFRLKIEDIGYGLQGKVGGSFSRSRLSLPDGKAHRPDKVFSAQIFEEFFPTSQEAD
jgi:hypothetical protein